MGIVERSRSHSMWNINTSKYTPARSMSMSSTSSSTWSLQDGSSPPKNIIKRLKHRNQNVQTTRITCAPCLCGDVNAVDSHGRSLLFYAARYGQTDPARQLIQADCDTNQADENGNTPLHEAVEKGNLEVARILLTEGHADANVPGSEGETPLMVAASRGQIDAVRLLQKHGANINQCDAWGNAPVHRALRQGWIDVVDFLLDHQCDVNIVPANGNDCLAAAVKCNKIPIDTLAKRLLKTNYDFKKDADWIKLESLPDSIKTDTKLHDKILTRAGLKDTSAKRKSFLRTGSEKLLRTIRGLSG